MHLNPYGSNAMEGDAAEKPVVHQFPFQHHLG
jgi:hypothetical protein